MEKQWVRLKDQQAFEGLLETSKEKPVVIFKHSLTCPISARAYDELSGFTGEVVLLEIQANRELSKEIEQRLGVVHESPQVIVLRDGKVVWDASHFDVTAAAVARAIGETGSQVNRGSQ